MLRCPDRLALWIWTRPWTAMCPGPLWRWIASPLLSWAMDCLNADDLDMVDPR